MTFFGSEDFTQSQKISFLEALLRTLLDDDALVQQARARLEAAHKVLAAVDSVTDCEVPVAFEDIDAWVMTMAGLRAQWNVELTGSGERLAEAKHRDMLRHPTAAAVTDWLAYQIEAALEARHLDGGAL